MIPRNKIVNMKSILSELENAIRELNVLHDTYETNHGLENMQNAVGLLNHLSSLYQSDSFYDVESFSPELDCPCSR